MQLFDTHAHLDQEDFASDLPDVLERARVAGVTRIVTVGCTVESSRQSVSLAAAHAGLFAAVGIQPNYCSQANPEDWDEIVRLADSPRVVALGETGLDRHWDYSPLDIQRDYFDRHLQLASRKKLPVIIHTRNSDADVLEMLIATQRTGPLRAVMHSFTGTAETAAECVDLGLYISFAGMVTFKKSQDLRDVAAKVPLDRLLIETDSPYLSPHPLRGKRNEPAHLVHTAACLAEVRNIPLDEFVRRTTENACRFLGMDN